MLPDVNVSLMNKQRLCPLQFAAIKSWFREPGRAQLELHFWPSAFAVTKRTGVKYLPLNDPKRVFFLMNFPPATCKFGHSTSGSTTGRSFSNATIRDLLQRLARDCMETYNVSKAEAVLLCDNAFIMEVNFGYRRADDCIGKHFKSLSLPEEWEEKPAEYQEVRI